MLGETHDHPGPKMMSWGDLFVLLHRWAAVSRHGMPPQRQTCCATAILRFATNSQVAACDHRGSTVISDAGELTVLSHDVGSGRVGLM